MATSHFRSYITSKSGKDQEGGGADSFEGHTTAYSYTWRNVGKSHVIRQNSLYHAPSEYKLGA